jgi:hypothetical protein
MSLDYSDIYELGVESDCCGASVVWVDLCTECMEHCTPVRKYEWDESHLIDNPRDEEESSLMDKYRDVGMSPGDFFKEDV